MNRAIFLDRDGTINEDVGDLYLPEHLKFIPGAIQALNILQEIFSLFIVTNQSGIARGVFSQIQYEAFNEFYCGILRGKNIRIQHTYCCPHIKEQSCICKKPSPFFLRMAEIHYGINLDQSFVVGDHPHDIELAHNARMQSVYVLTGHGEKHRKNLNIQPDFIADDLLQAASWIMRKN